MKSEGSGENAGRVEVNEAERNADSVLTWGVENKRNENEGLCS